MKLAIMIQIGRIAVDRLLKIADHAEMSRAGRIAFGFKPFADGVRRSRDFEQHKKLLRIGALSFIENYAIMFLANPLRHIRQTQQFSREGDLVAISDRTMS